MKRAAMWSVAMSLVLGSCAGPGGRSLEVKQFTLRETNPSVADDLMVRGEVQRRLHGAVSPSERQDRLGQYYTVLWQDDSEGGPAELVFEYQQAATGALVKRSYRNFEAGAISGKAEFQVTGEDFRKNGRVLAWRVTLRRGERAVASRQSYLWR